jgi:transglutaminase superfamily protein
MNVQHIRFLERWRRYRKLSREDRGFVLRGMTLLSLTMLGLRTMSFRRCKRLIQQFSSMASSPRRTEPDCHAEQRRKIVSAMNAVERNGPWRPNCLERSLALWWLLQLNATDGELHIGGRKSQGRFEAHAWVEWNGHVLNDSMEVHKHYARFDAPIAAAEADSH